MKIIVVLLTTFLAIQVFFSPFGCVFPEELFKDNRAQKFSEIEMFNHPVVQASKSMICINAGENKTATVVLDYGQGLTWMTVGLSTIVKPEAGIAGKIDSNLLNVTSLVAKDYILDNKTNVIISLSNDSIVEEIAGWSVERSLSNGIERMYVSNQAYGNMRLFATCLNYSAIFALARNPQINHIWLNRRFKACLDQSVSIVKNSTQWAALESSFNRSIRGAGIKIAILDTGIDPTHPDFNFPNGTSKIARAISFVTGESTADGFGHGTHCASIAAGTGAASNGLYTGIAPEALLLNVKVLDNTGEGLEDWIISGIQWAVDNGAEIVSMSLGGDVGTDGTDPLSTTVNWATEQGTTCAVAAGNSGSEIYTITNPGTAEFAITVGASSKSDTIASFSSRGPTVDNRIKPDILAPGVDITAARAAGTSMGTPVSEYYTKASGTSMATPHVAGAVALLLDAHPSWNPRRIKMALSNYAKDLGVNVFEQGAGRLDICRGANASLVGNSSLSIGRVHLNTTYKHIIEFQNLCFETITAMLQAETWSVETKTPYNVVTLNTSSLTLASGATGNVKLTLTTNGALQDGYYEGNVTATFNGANIRIPIFFCILSQLNVQVTDEKGSALMSSFVLINAQTTAMQAYFSECSSAEFTVPPGDYIVQAMDIYGLNPALGTLDASFSFLIFKEVSLGTDQTINLQLSLSSTYKLSVRSTDVENTPLHLVNKMLYTLYYGMGYLSDTLGQYASQYLYLTDISDYLKGPCFFGFAGFPQDYSSWNQTGTLTSEVDMYFLGWDLSTFGPSNMPAALTFTNSELATFNIDTLLPESSPVSIIWFNQIAGMWQSGFWYGYQTHPGILWKTHILPYQYRTSPSANWSQLEWSCMYTFSTNFGSAEDYVIDRHFQPITKGENSSYSIGKTPLLPQDVVQDPPDVGSGLYVPYYPLRIEKNLFIDKTGMQATKRLEVFKNGNLIHNETSTWSQAPIPISQFLNSYGPGLYTFVVKTNTSFNYSSQNVAEYTINYTSGSTDLIPPSITRIDCDPCFTKSGHQVEIEVADNYEISNVTLLYSIDDGPLLPSTLTHVGNYSYATNLTFPISTQKISLAIEASDGNGNKIRFQSTPAATRGYETKIDATLTGNHIAGKLTIIGGSLLQQLYLTVRSDQETWFTLTDSDGNFAFDVPPSLDFPLTIETSAVGPYDKSTYVKSNLPHDVCIVSVAPCKTIVGQGYLLGFTVAVGNLADYLETFNVTIFVNDTATTSKTATVTGWGSINITLSWDTSGFTKGNYRVSAYAWPVPGETSTGDNTFVDGVVTVVLAGDLNDDGIVDYRDINRVARMFGKTLGDPQWDPNSDIIEDGIIDCRDINVPSRNYGKTRP
jgi:subtilisin family serine protease